MTITNFLGGKSDSGLALVSVEERGIINEKAFNIFNDLDIGIYFDRLWGQFSKE